MTFARGRPKTKPTEAVDNKTLDTADKGGCEDAFNRSRHRGRLVGRLAASSKDQAGAVELACAARASRQLPQMPDGARGKGLGVGLGWGEGVIGPKAVAGQAQLQTSAEKTVLSSTAILSVSAMRVAVTLCQKPSAT